MQSVNQSSGYEQEVSHAVIQCLSVCLSVHLVSVMFVYCIKTSEHLRCFHHLVAI